MRGPGAACGAGAGDGVDCQCRVMPLTRFAALATSPRWGEVKRLRRVAVSLPVGERCLERRSFTSPRWGEVEVRAQARTSGEGALCVRARKFLTSPLLEYIPMTGPSPRGRSREASQGWGRAAVAGFGCTHISKAAAQAAQARLTGRGPPVEDKKVRPPGSSRSKPQTPRAGCRGSGGACGLHTWPGRPGPPHRRETIGVPRGPKGSRRPARPSFEGAPHSPGGFPPRDG